MKIDLAFLKRCRDSSVVHLFARISHHLNKSSNHRIFLNASLTLIRSKISRVRGKLDFLSRNLLSLHLELSSLLSLEIWVRIKAYSALKTLQMEEIWTKKQCDKFSKLSNKSSFGGNSSIRSGFYNFSSNSRINSNQVAALSSWIHGNSSDD